MLYGYHEEKDVRIAIRVERERDRKIIDLEALGVDTLVPLHSYDNNLSTLKNEENCIYVQQLEKIHEVLGIDRGRDKNGDTYMAFATLYDVSTSSFFRYIHDTQIPLEGKEEMWLYAGNSWMLFLFGRDIDLIKKEETSDIKNKIPKYLLKKCEDIETYTISRCDHCEKKIYNIIFKNGKKKKCDTINDVKKVLKAASPEM